LPSFRIPQPAAKRFRRHFFSGSNHKARYAHPVWVGLGESVHSNAFASANSKRSLNEQWRNIHRQQSAMRSRGRECVNK
jgi:hypothetical protein